MFKLFDFFANCEYFEEKLNYIEKLKLPQPKKGGAFTEIREARIEIARVSSTNYNGIEAKHLFGLLLGRQNTTKSGLISRSSFLASIHAFYGSTGKATFN